MGGAAFFVPGCASLLALAALAGGPCCCCGAMARPVAASRCLVVCWWGCLQACFLLFAGGVQAFCWVSCPLWVASGVLLALGAVPRPVVLGAVAWLGFLVVLRAVLRGGFWCWFLDRPASWDSACFRGFLCGGLVSAGRVFWGVWYQYIPLVRAVVGGGAVVRPWPSLLALGVSTSHRPGVLLGLGVGCELVAAAPVAAAWPSAVVGAGWIAAPAGPWPARCGCAASVLGLPVAAAVVGRARGPRAAVAGPCCHWLSLGVSPAHGGPGEWCQRRARPCRGRVSLSPRCGGPLVGALCACLRRWAFGCLWSAQTGEGSRQRVPQSARQGRNRGAGRHGVPLKG